MISWAAFFDEMLKISADVTMPAASTDLRAKSVGKVQFPTESSKKPAADALEQSGNVGKFTGAYNPKGGL